MGTKSSYARRPSRRILTRTAALAALVVAVAACSDSTASTTTSGPPDAATTEGAPTTTTSTIETTTTSSITTDAALEPVVAELRTWGVSDESIRCVTDGLTDGGYVEELENLSLLDTLFFDETAPLSEAPPELANFVDGLMRFLIDPQDGCLRPSELSLAIGNLTAAGEDLGFSSYGDDPTLDELHDGCIAGSLAECDMLWIASDLGSEYEQVAATCGGQVEGLDFTATCIGELQDFSEAERLESECENGFFLACDVYFLITAIGSPEEELAASCGGIREPNQTTPCWLVYGFGSR